MIDATIKLHGASEIDNLLKQLGNRKFQEQVMITAVRKTAKFLAEEISDRAPTDFGVLEESIGVQMKKVQGVSAAAKIGLEPIAFYGMFQEFGTDIAPAQPFMRPAFDENSTKMIQMVGEFAIKQINLKAKQLGRAAKFKKKRRK